MCEMFKPDVLQYLVGNSFCAADCSAAILVGRVCLSDAFQAKIVLLTQVPKPISPVRDRPDVPDHSDEDSSSTPDFSRRSKRRCLDEL